MTKKYVFAFLLSLPAAALMSFAPVAAAQPECAAPNGSASGTPCENSTPGGGTTGVGPGGGGESPYNGGAGCIPDRVCNNGGN